MNMDATVPSLAARYKPTRYHSPGTPPRTWTQRAAVHRDLNGRSHAPAMTSRARTDQNEPELRSNDAAKIIDFTAPSRQYGKHEPPRTHHRGTGQMRRATLHPGVARSSHGYSRNAGGGRAPGRDSA